MSAAAQVVVAMGWRRGGREAPWVNSVYYIFKKIVRDILPSSYWTSELQRKNVKAIATITITTTTAVAIVKTCVCV